MKGVPEVDSVVAVLLQEYSARPVVPAVTAAAAVEVGEDVVVVALGELLGQNQLYASLVVKHQILTDWKMLRCPHHFDCRHRCWTTVQLPIQFPIRSQARERQQQ